MFNVYTLTTWMLLEQELMQSLHLCGCCVSYETWNFYEDIPPPVLSWSEVCEWNVNVCIVYFLSHPTVTKSAKVCLTQEHLISTPFHLWPWEIRVTKFWDVQCACKSYDTVNVAPVNCTSIFVLNYCTLYLVSNNYPAICYPDMYNLCYKCTKQIGVVVTLHWFISQITYLLPWVFEIKVYLRLVRWQAG